MLTNEKSRCQLGRLKGDYNSLSGGRTVYLSSYIQVFTYIQVFAMYQFAGHLSRMALYRLLLAKEIIYLSTKLLCFNGPQFAVTGRGKIAAVQLL